MPAKKWAVAAIALLSLPLSCLAASDPGPFYVKLGTGCTKAALYLSTTAVGSTLYGKEVGCTQFLGAPYVGNIDFKSATIYLSSVAAGSIITYQINISTSSGDARISDGQAVFSGPTFYALTAN